MDPVLQSYGVVAHAPGQWMVRDTETLPDALETVLVLQAEDSLRVEGALIELQHGEQPVQFWSFTGGRWAERRFYIGDTPVDARVRRNLARALVAAHAIEPSESAVRTVMAAIHPAAIERLRAEAPAVYERLRYEPLVPGDLVAPFVAEWTAPAGLTH